ncbi:hypothetical protein FAM21834_00057 [Lentilactobacillus parabuchneri]|jgi:Na+/proline symporter|uniref:Uncharacterized protein n=1 Tax=Lentilactobacillus parabuchneri TaxID=152331 RepID=A0A1X1FHY4_9LACO|nr:hypothetical protein FAM21731_00075 [Lentilactobacillus parabuchneri]MCT2885314.1 hypothetical protein [Lentilactobacillus parabuchneri]OBU97538.1 hypothetical protein A7B51_02915 [Lentilactobacillus parabuchneri]OCB82338.1 hypothetical protein A8O18_03160 [Lentilactobacillus parabuchneri]OCB83059.1 hypothetical protein A7322_03505 [Lentilactobacillus parabuchneri]
MKLKISDKLISNVARTVCIIVFLGFTTIYPAEDNTYYAVTAIIFLVAIIFSPKSILTQRIFRLITKNVNTKDHNKNS